MSARIRNEAADPPAQTEAASEFDALLQGRTDPARRSRQQPVQRERATDAGAAKIGRIASLDENGVVSVHVQGWSHAIPARLATPLPIERILSAIATVQPVVMLFEDADPLRPIIIGLVASESPAPAGDAEPAAADVAATAVIEADVDGRRVRITAQDEIVLQCGQASVTLRRNGRIVIRGTHVESDSAGTNRIKGGQVRIN